MSNDPRPKEEPMTDWKLQTRATLAECDQLGVERLQVLDRMEAKDEKNADRASGT
jgi:hypothetical protein